MSNETDAFGLSAQERAALDEGFEHLDAVLGGGDDKPAPEYSLLRVWTEVLSNIEDELQQPVSLGVAGKIVASWPFIKMQETPQFHTRYHELLLECRAELERVIRENPGAIDFEGEDDIVENGKLYKELIVAWSLLLSDHEEEWRAGALDSHILYAVLVDVQAFLFSQNGLAGHLTAKGFELTSDEIVEAITVAREERGE